MSKKSGIALDNTINTVFVYIIKQLYIPFPLIVYELIYNESECYV